MSGRRAPSAARRRAAAVFARAILPAAAALACAVLARPVLAQDAPDVPAGDARLEGRVVYEDGASGAPGVGVILYSLSAGGDPGLRQTRTDETGAFAFEGIAGDPGIVYLVGTRVEGVPFGARVVFEEGETSRRVEIAVSEPSLRAGEVRGLEPEVRLERGCSHLRVRHLHPLRNDEQRVVFVPPDAREGATPVLELLLPEGATEIEPIPPLSPDGLSREGRRLRYWGPVYPGTSTVEFGYGLPLAAESSLEIGFPEGVESLRVLAPLEGARVRGEGLQPEGERALPGGAARSLRADAIPPGGALQLQVSLDPREAAQPQFDEARLWLELDDAALDVSEQYELRVDAEAPLVSSADTPLLCLELPPGAESLRFSNASLQMGLSRDPGGTLALHGPIPPGTSSLALRYRLPAPDDPARFERSFPRDVPLLTLLVADTGLVPETQRLHRRRPVRTEDRAYLHLEGFGIEAGTPVSLSLRPLPPREPLPGLASSGLVFGLALLSLVFLVRPLRGEEAEHEPSPAEPPTAVERQAVIEALGALDEDFQTGKLSEEDHARMRDELRARAVALLREERAAERARETDAPPACSHCGAEVRAGDRFCSGCGAEVRAADRSCPRCGTETRVGDRFCAQCGTELLGAPPAP